jgi:hypothetical protein
MNEIANVIQLLSNKYGFDIQEATTYIESIITPSQTTLVSNTLTDTPVAKVIKKRVLKPKKVDVISIPELTTVIESLETLVVHKEETPIKEEKPVKEKPVKEKPVKEKVVKEKPVKEKVVKEKVVKEKVVKEKVVKEKVVKEKVVKEKPVKEKKTTTPLPPPPQPKEEEEEDNVYMKSIYGKHYFVNEDTGVIYAVAGDCEKGEIVGQWGIEGPDIW